MLNFLVTLVFLGYDLKSFYIRYTFIDRCFNDFDNPLAIELKY